MKIVYAVREFNLIGTKLYTYKEMPELQERENKYYYKDSNYECETYGHYKLTTDLSKYENLFKDTDQFLPYRANVTEDLPGSATKVGLKPKTYTDCILMSEKHGNYLQFYHKPTDKVLIIAMNSHVYQPV